MLQMSGTSSGVERGGAQGSLFPSQHPYLSTSWDRPCEKPVRRRFGSLPRRRLVWAIAQGKNDGPGVICQLGDQYGIKILYSTEKAKRLQLSACTIGDFSKAFPKDLYSDRASPGNPAARWGRQSVTVLEKHSAHSKRPDKSKRISKNG